MNSNYLFIYLFIAIGNWTFTISGKERWLQVFIVFIHWVSNNQNCSVLHISESNKAILRQIFCLENIIAIEPQH